MRAVPRKLIVMGPSAPPVYGNSVLTPVTIASLQRLGLFAAHVDTRDRRTLANLNRLDLENVRLGLLHAWLLLGAMHRHRDAGVYVQISQGRWGFLRDALWIGLARARRRPVYIHLHGGCFDEFHDESGPVMRRLIRATIGQAETLWVLTPSLRSCFDGLAEPERVSVLENVAPDPMVGFDRSGMAERNGNGFRILFLANLREGKGHLDLLAALEVLGRRPGRWYARFVGEHDEATAAVFGEWVRSRPDGSVRAELVGPRMGIDKASELAWADAFAFPTRYRNEGQPLVVLEAMAAGLPIVSTRYRGIPHTIHDQRHALLVDPGDVGALAAALARLAEDPGLRDRLGAAARDRYEERYTPAGLDARLAELLGARR